MNKRGEDREGERKVGKGRAMAKFCPGCWGERQRDLYTYGIKIQYLRTSKKQVIPRIMD